MMLICKVGDSTAKVVNSEQITTNRFTKKYEI